jgi:cation/acetate symporter
VYGLPAESAPISLNNPGIISIPLAFITLIVVSLMTQKKDEITQEKQIA